MDNSIQMKLWLTILITTISNVFLVEKHFPQQQRFSDDPPYLNFNQTWVDSLMVNMTLEEKIGQLFMIAAYSNKSEAEENAVEKYISEYHIGGLIFFQGSPTRQAQLTNRYQQASKLPLMIGMDAEWGIGMRLDSSISYPRQLLLGAIQDDRIIYEMGQIIGQQLRRLGVHINFAPVIDVNNNPKNPVINDRSFGEVRENVSKKGIAYMKGLQSEGVLACGKHFPGHGDTDVDSHKDLPVINHLLNRLDSIELYPFKQLINEGLGSIMVAHLSIPELDATPNLPSTLSTKIVNGLLKEQMGFKGLVFTDALQMKGVTKYYDPGQVEVNAMLAGNDVLLFSENVPVGVKKVKEAIVNGKISEARLNESVRKILLAKKWMGLFEEKDIKVDNITEDVNGAFDTWYRTKLIESAITVVRDSNYIIPIRELQGEHIACVSIGSNKETPFTQMLDNYAPIKHYFISKNADKSSFDNLLKALDKHSLVICAVQNMSRYASRNHGLKAAEIDFIKALDKKKRTLTTIFGSPYSLDKLDKLNHTIVAYENSIEAQEIAAQVIFGGRSARGKLPVGAGSYKAGDGINTIDPIRLKYGSSIELGIAEDAWYKIDSIAEEAIAIEATPGCQVLIAKDGLVFYQKSFGKHTYEKDASLVKNDNLYDLASITKIAASTALLMQMHESEMIDVEGSLGDYLAFVDTSNKKDLVLKEILAHQSGLKAWIPFYLRTFGEDERLRPTIFSNNKNEEFCYRVVEDLYICKSYQDSIWFQIESSDLREKKDYKYSDLGYYFFKKIIEEKYNKSISLIADELFYDPLGLSTMTYLPHQKFDKASIVPTEEDKIFRGKVVHGDVHDPGAAMMGGIGGHAGLFSNANDLAIFMQMLLNGGLYGSRRYLDNETIDYFTTAHFENNRKGLGFDKRDPNFKWGSACDSASLSSFGHTGFTGTMVWSDPEYNLTYVFLSNRIHPDANNKKLIKENIRTKMHQTIYDVIIPLEKEKK